MTKSREGGITWLASYPKSGNTWVRALLSAYLRDSPLNLNAMDWVTGDSERWAYQLVSPQPVGGLSLSDQMLIRGAALATITAARGWKKPFLLKTHFADVQIDDIRTIPLALTSGAFYVVRDPRAVAVSYSNHFNASLWDAASALSDTRRCIVDAGYPTHFLSSWSKHVRSWLDEKDFQVTLIRYERLREDPAGVLRGVLRRLDFVVDEMRIERAVAECEFERMQKQEKERGFQEAPPERTFFRDGGRTHWSDVLEPEQAAYIERDHWEMMHRLGYIDDDTAALRESEGPGWNADGYTSKPGADDSPGWGVESV